MSNFIETLKHDRGAQSIVASVILLLVLVLIFYSINPRFASWINVFNLMRQSAVLLLVATGATFIILMGSIDLSVGSVVTLTAIASALLLKNAGFGAAETVLAAALIGAVCGAINGALVVFGGLPSFIVTLGTMIVFGGVAVTLSGGANIVFRVPEFTWLSSGKMIWRIPNAGIWALIIFFIASIVGARSHFGRQLYAIGAGGTTAKLSGVRVTRIKMAAFCMAGVLCGIAGALLVARTSTGTARMGDDLLLESIAAVVMGGTALSGGAGGVHRTILGVLVIAVLKNGLNVIGVHHYWQTIITGLIVIIAVTLTLDRSRMAFVK